jgi:hypothetical protein
MLSVYVDMNGYIPYYRQFDLPPLPRRPFIPCGINRLNTLKVVFLSLMCLVCFLPAAWAAHPLISDDAYTQGRGKLQIEIDNQISNSKETVQNDDGTSSTVKSMAAESMFVVSYGMIDPVDLVVGIPYQWQRTKTDDVLTAKADGLADISMEVKWRFFEKDGFSLAAKPGITLPAGDRDKGLGTGRVGYTFFFIASKELDPLLFHLNLGYRRNENKVDQREDIWHASLAGEWKLAKNLRLVANIGVERNTDRASSIDPAFLLGGVIYSLTEDFDLDVGIKGPLTPAEPDVTVLAGVTYRF